MERVFISIGSNLGDRVKNCRDAASALLTDPSTAVMVRGSSLYETEPWGDTGQGRFVNRVVEIETRLPPFELLDFLKSIESRMGRKAGERWGPRLIDLDILFYGDRVVDEEGLAIPHRHLAQRAFVLVPLAEIAPGFVHPVIKKSVAELAASAEGRGGVRKLDV